MKFAPPYPVLISGTTDGGVNWTIPLQVNNPSQRGLGANIATGSGGTVYVCWAGVISTSPFTEDIVGFAHRGAGDSAWTVTENAYDINGIAGTLPQKANIRVNGTPRMAVDNSGGPYDGRIYIVSTQKNLSPAGSDPDIVIRSSSDSGLSWSARGPGEPGRDEQREDPVLPRHPRRRFRRGEHPVLQRRADDLRFLGGVPRAIGRRGRVVGGG